MLDTDIPELEREAKQRNDISKQRGWFNRAKTDRDELYGVAGEFTASLMYNLPWKRTSKNHTIQDFRSGDLGDFIEVKTRIEMWSNRWDLAVNEYDLKDDRAYVNCIGCLYPNWMIVTGFAWGSEIRKGMTMKHSKAGHNIKILSIDRIRAPVLLFDVLRARTPHSI